MNMLKKSLIAQEIVFQPLVLTLQKYFNYAN
jgi:hypothetical protein